MKTVEETRRERLKILVERHGGDKDGMANLCEALGYARNNTAGLTRILNANIRHDRDGEAYEMGSKKAREIENTLKLPQGWMDTPPTYSELNGSTDPLSKALDIMTAMEPEARYQALRLLDALAQPPQSNGTHGNKH
jgi:hypothetical protein